MGNALRLIAISFLAYSTAKAGNGNFTCAQGFCDVFQNQNNGNWAVDILNVASATVDSPATPKPASIVPGAAGLSILMLARRRRAARPIQNLRRSL
jgi:hypothetical protein